MYVAHAIGISPVTLRPGRTEWPAVGCMCSSTMPSLLCSPFLSVASRTLPYRAPLIMYHEDVLQAVLPQP